MQRLNEALVRQAKPRTKPYKLPRENGLYLLVNPDGGKWWRFSYTFAGKEKLLSFGQYPEISLRGARLRRDDARRQIRDGVDPSAARKAERAERVTAEANTFKAIATEWLQLRVDSMAPVTHAKARWMLEAFAFPELGPMPLESIGPPEVLRALRKVESSGKLETLHRVKGRISEVFRYAIVTGRAHSDPTRDLRGALKPKRPTRHLAALTDPKEVGALLRAIDGYRGAPETCAALKLAPLLFVRPGELRAALWPQFDLNAEKPAWRYFVTKTKTDHIVPLSLQAVAILRELQLLTGRGIPSRPEVPAFVFPNIRRRDKPMSENALTAALRGMGYTGDQMTWHGFRAMARTMLSELGWRPDAIERQLAHKASGPLGAAYDRAQYLEERRQMMQAWADYLDGLRRGNVQAVFQRAA